MKAEVKIPRGWKRITGMVLIEEGDLFFSSWNMQWESADEEWIDKIPSGETVIRKVKKARAG